VLELKVDEIVDWLWEELKLPDLKPKRSASLDDPEYVREGWDKRGAHSRLDRRRTIKEAVKRRARVTLCRSATDADPVCDADGTGYIVFANAADDQTFDKAADTLIKAGTWLADGVTVQYDGLPTYVSYTASGFTRAVGGGTLAGNIVVCDDRGDRAARVISLAATGRPQSRAHTDVAGAPSCE